MPINQCGTPATHYSNTIRRKIVGMNYKLNVANRTSLYTAREKREMRLQTPRSSTHVHMRQIYIILIYSSNALMHHFSELIQLYINQLSSVDLAARLLPIIFHPHPFERRRLKTKGENARQRSTVA